MKHLFTLAFILLCASASFGQLMVSTLFQNWEEDVWVNSSRTLYSYENVNMNDRLITSLYESNYGNGLETSSKTDYTYDANGNLTSEINYTWDAAQETWINNLKKSSTYNADNKLVSILSEIWVNNAWQNSSQQTQTYDASGFLVHVELQTWNQNNWQNLTQYDLVNNAGGKVIQSTFEAWSSGNWIPESRFNYTYTAFGAVETNVEEHWTSGSWVNYLRQTLTYDAGELVLTKLSESWNGTQWGNIMHIDYFNFGSSVNEFIVRSWNATTSSWENTLKATYAYLYIVTGLEELAANPVEVYPNPAHDLVYVKFGKATQANIQVLDLSGKIVTQIEAGGVIHAIDISEMADGVYSVVVNADGKREVRKVVKK